MNTPTSSHRTLKWALTILSVIHAALLTLHFAAPETFKGAFEDVPLEFMQVNARRQASSDKAQTLAQAHWAGRGQNQEGLISTSPLPTAIQSEEKPGIRDWQKKPEALKVGQFELLTLMHDALTMCSEDSIGAPRQRCISPAAWAVTYAVCCDKLRRAIETNGAHNFSEEGGKKIYRALSRVLTIGSSGQLTGADIAHRSGKPLPVNRALAIVRNAAPCDAFSTKLRRSVGQIVVASRSRWTREKMLNTVIQKFEEQTP